MSYPILPEAFEEIKEKLSKILDAILVEAIKIAHKDGHPYIDKTYIEKASKRIKMLGNGTKIWALRITLVLMVPFIFNQIGIMCTPEVLASPAGLQNSLWILPIFAIFFVIILSWALKDFIF